MKKNALDLIPTLNAYSKDNRIEKKMCNVHAKHSKILHIEMEQTLMYHVENVCSNFNTSKDYFKKHLFQQINRASSRQQRMHYIIEISSR